MATEDELHESRENLQFELAQAELMARLNREAFAADPTDAQAEVRMYSYEERANELRKKYHEVIRQLSLSHLDNAPQG